MKTIFVFSLLILTVNCGLLDKLTGDKEESKKPDLLKKVVTGLKDDGKIVVDILTDPLKKKTEDKNGDAAKDDKEPENSKSEDTAASTPKTPEDTKPKAENKEVTEVPVDKAETTKAEEVSPPPTTTEPPADAKEAATSPKAK